MILLGRHSIEAAVAMLGGLHRGAVLAPLPPMFNQTQMAALAEQTGAKAIVSFGGEKEIAKCREVAGAQLPLVTVLPEHVDGAEALDDARASRHGDELALVLHSSGTTSAPKGIAHSLNTLRYATEGFMNEITRRQGAKRSWRSERPSPDRIVFSLDLPQLMRS